MPNTIMNITETWTPLGLLSETTTDFAKYNKDIGVYRAILNNEIVYIGKATELKSRGFRKRLRDYTRKSDSAKNYPSERLMYQHRNEAYIEILILTGSSAKIIESIEARLIAEVKPKWNSLD